MNEGIIFFVKCNCVLGIDAKRVLLEEDLTVLIDYEKYQENVKHRRLQRQVLIANNSAQFMPYPLSFRNGPPSVHPQQLQRDYPKHDARICGGRGSLLFANDE